jgi:hypothetical protein
LNSNRNISLALMVLVAAPALASEQDFKQDILQNETKVWVSFVGAHPDVVAFRRLVLPDYVGIEAAGILVDEAETVQQLKQLTVSPYKLEDPRVRRLSATSALIVDRVRFEGSVGGQRMAREALTSTVWVKRDGRWLAQLHTETPKK